MLRNALESYIITSMELSFFNIDQLCNSTELTDDKLLIDLSRVAFVRPFALVYLGMFMRYHNSCGKGCVLIPPNSPIVRNYLARQNFWERFNFHPDTIKAENLRRFTTSTSLNDIIDIEKRTYIAEDIADAAKRLLRTNSVRVNTAEIEVIVCELVDNFARHSERTLAAFHMQYYPNRKHVVIAIGDCGIGIRASLATNPKYKSLMSYPHYEVALKSFEPLITRLPEGGTGLTDVKDGVIRLNGRMILSTGDGYVIMTDTDIKYGQMAYDLPGVQIELMFPEV